MKKTQEQQAISEPLEALDAIEAALTSLVANPELADVMDGATLRPISKVITRKSAPDEEATTITEFSFSVTQDGAGGYRHTVSIPEPERLLIEA